MTCASPPIHTPAPIRSASTNIVPPAPPKKTSQATSPGIPLATQPVSASTNSDFLAIKLPDLSQPLPNAPVQVVSFIRFVFGSIVSSIYLSVKSDLRDSPMSPTFGIPPNQEPSLP